MDAAGLNATQQSNVIAGVQTPTRYSRLPDEQDKEATDDIDTDYSSLYDSARQDEIKRQQDQISSIEKMYDTQLAQEVDQETKAGERDMARSNTISALTGMMGAPEATTRAGNSDRQTKKNIQDVTDKVNAQKSAAISAIYGRIDSNAAQAAQIQLQTSRERQKELQGTTAANALNNVLAFAQQQGVTWDTFSRAYREDADLQAEVERTGKSLPELYELYTNAQPAAPKKQYMWQGNNLVVLQENADGSLSTQTFTADDLGIPKGTDFQTMTLGDSVYWLDKNDPYNADGTPKLTKLGTDPDAALKKAQTAKAYADISAGAGGGQNDQLYAGLSSATATAVRARVSKYATDNVIQNFATVQDGYNFATSIADDTKNPADDQALLYSLAKVLDPGSVVREGEYATAQKYAQSWVSAYGKGISQALLGTGFLSETARKNIKQTITQKYQQTKRGYDQVNQSYADGINALTGRSDGAKFLTDYVTQPSEETPQGDSRQTVVDFAGQNTANRDTVMNLLQQNPNYSYDDIRQILGI